ncbi:cell wall-binding repeat-containing protein [Microbacterium sp. R86528]|uniref:cell wall-binding repeat-containing protein n=1 Tax=Microbacterium sp. R86528 TaxID=3093864 RepID=UPI0037C5AF9E
MPTLLESTLPARAKALAALLTSVLIAALLVVAPTSDAEAADLPGSILEGGYIISDAAFFDGDSMNATQIQTFLNSKVSNCASGYTCLKSYKADIAAKSADKYCSALSAQTGVSAATIINKVALACGISPKVLLVMLQKEQGLVTSTAPSSTMYGAAMGQSCPDTAACDPRQAGFFNQMYGAARQMQVYTQNPSWYNYKAGQINTIQWHPNSSCGTSKVYIQNQATANLYIYTPYRANVAALSAGWGTGDTCSTYGNRNFYNYYVAWFDPGASSSTGAPAQTPACQLPLTADISSRTGTATVKIDNLNVRSAPTLVCTTGITQIDKGATVSITGQYGAWTRATLSGKTVWISSQYLTLPSTDTPTGGTDACAQPSESSVVPASGSVYVTVSALNVRTAPTTACDTGRIQLGQGDTATRTGEYGVWWRITVSGKSYWAHSDYLSTYDPVTFPSTRISGESRYDTAVAVSKKAYPSGTDTLFIASGVDYPDALGAGAAAGVTDAALLLTEPDQLRDSVGKEVQRLSPATIYLIGGEDRISGALAQAIAIIAPTAKIERVAGVDRYETSRMIAGMFFESATTAYVATGANFPDSVVAAGLGGAFNRPVVLVNGAASSADPVTVLAMKDWGITRVIVAGDEKAVSTGIRSGIANAGIAVDSKYGGIDRYDTGRMLVAEAYPQGASGAYLASGELFPDALTGAVLAAQQGWPLLTTPKTCIRSSTKDWLVNANVSGLTLLGGEPSLTSAVASSTRC